MPKKKPVVDGQAFAVDAVASFVVAVGTAVEAVAVVDTAGVAAAVVAAAEVLVVEAYIAPENRHFEVLEGLA